MCNYNEALRSHQAMNLPEAKPSISSSLYDTDFYAWTQEQAMLLKNQQWSQLDVPNIIEEIESLGKQQRQELRNRMSVLIGHLLKWQYQPQNRSRSWLATLRIQRLDINDLLEDNPSLKPYIEEAIEKAYLKGVELAVKETDLSGRTFPRECPYALEEMLSDRFFPGEASELLED
ncbi:DUF29 domain-containing protein [Leptolyngbya sp. AN03gr2]